MVDTMARLALLVLVLVGCGSTGTLSGPEPLTDAGPALDMDGADAASEPDAGAEFQPDAGVARPVDGGPAPDAGPPETYGGPAPTPDAGVVAPEPIPGDDVRMTFATVNIGRNYGTRAQVASVIRRVADVVGSKLGDQFIGWQEIGEGDPCGGCELEIVQSAFGSGGGWNTWRPAGTRPDGANERVKVPVTARRANGGASARAAFASPGWAGVSPTRFVTVVHYPQRNLSMINTHLIAGAWSCKSNRDQRRDYWRRGWDTLKAQVRREHDRGRNVIVTGDLNRPRGANSCNPAWDPTSLHGQARIIGGAGIDYVFAVPAPGWSFAFDRRGDDSIRRGSFDLGIDSHRGHWVTGRFGVR